MGDADNKVKKPVELTKKQELNNHIVLMRIIVRTAKVHIINKLTKDIKKLKDRKGDDKSLEKNKRKIDRFVEEVQIIKHLREDKISIYALQDTTTKLEQVLQNSKASTENRALARFSHHKLIQPEVLWYRNHNPYWKLQIPVLLERSKDKRRRINKKLAEREADLAIAKQRKKGVNGSSKVVVEKDSSSSELDIKDGQEDSDNDNNNSLDKSIKGQDIEKDVVDTDATFVKSKIIRSKPKQDKVNKKQKKSLKKVSNQPPVEISKSSGTIKVQHLKDLTDLENNSESINKPQVELFVENLSKVPKQRPKSSFFVGGVDEIVETTLEPHHERRNFSAKKHQQPSSKEFKPIFKKGKLVNKTPNSFNNKPGGRPRGGGGRNPRRFQNEDSSNLTPLGDRQEIKKATSSATTTTQSEKLHPSWEAKKRLQQQQQPTLTAFQGKKIKFDD